MNVDTIEILSHMTADPGDPNAFVRDFPDDPSVTEPVVICVNCRGYWLRDHHFIGWDC